MKQLSVVALFLFAACASTGTPDDDGPMPPPPQQASDVRLSELQTSLTELLERLDVLNERIARLEAGSAAPAVDSPPRPQASPPSASQPAPQQEETRNAAPQSRSLAGAELAERYRAALMLYGGGKHAEARRAFQQVFDSDPSGDLADNALFWIAESYYSAADYPNALRFYRRVVAEFREENKAPDALFKIAMTQEKSGDLVLARQTLNELINRYPYSTAAATAKGELKRIRY
ncbi:MAG TPA: tol-pal system protein YbgF [Thermoanaerobaculia bacterium]|nr:tol-pal system protein YbgF [Thermoanaerobaculia bacterium]